MQPRTHSLRFIRQRKFYTALPLLILPFLTLLFWALIGDGSSGPKLAGKGLILSLPEAILKDDKNPSKLSFYQKAAADSAKLRDLIKKDPYYRDTVSGDGQGILGMPLKGLNGPGKGTATKKELDRSGLDEQEKQVHQRLAELDKVLAKSTRPSFEDEKESRSNPSESASEENLARLQQLIGSLDEAPQESEDTEMQALNGMLDKILEIQNPELANEKLMQLSKQNGNQVYTVIAFAPETPITLLEAHATNLPGSSAMSLSQGTGFHSMDEPAKNQVQTAIQASIEQSQVLVSGSWVKLRLDTDVYVAGSRIKAGTLIYGKASLNQERLQVRIESIRNDHAIFPVSLSVYDLDGVEGIYIPGAIARDVGKQSSDRAIQGINIPILDPSLGAQAASTGIEAAKTFLGRKAKLVQVSVKAGYRVLLRDKNAKSF